MPLASVCDSLFLGVNEFIEVSSIETVITPFCLQNWDPLCVSLTSPSWLLNSILDGTRNRDSNFKLEALEERTDADNKI